jgi:hypothetical protein
MVSLIDIGPSRGVVQLRGKDVETNGLTADHIAIILSAFPEIRKMMVLESVEGNVIASLISRIPEAAAVIIAAGVGHAGDAKFIEFAGSLSVGEQFDIIENIVEMTFPRGLKSFLDGVQALVNQSGARGWAADTKLPEQSNSVSNTEETSDSAGQALQSS